MSDPEPSSYQKFMLNDDTPEVFAEAETAENSDCLEDRRIRNIHRRLTLQAFLLSCLVVAAVSAAYLHLKAGEDTFRRTLVMQSFQSFQEVEAELKALSARYDTLQAGLNEKFPSLNETAATLKTDFEKSRQTLQRLDNDLKVEQKQRMQSLQKVEKQFTTLSSELKQLQEKSLSQDTRIEQNVTRLNSMLSREIEPALAELRTDMHERQQTMDTVRKAVNGTQSSLKRLETDLKQKISRQELDTALQSGQQAFRKELNALLKRMIRKEKRLMALEEQTRRLEQALQTDFRRETLPSLYSEEPLEKKNGIEEKSLAP